MWIALFLGKFGGPETLKPPTLIKQNNLKPLPYRKINTGLFYLVGTFLEDVHLG